MFMQPTLAHACYTRICLTPLPGRCIFLFFRIMVCVEHENESTMLPLTMRFEFYS